MFQVPLLPATTTSPGRTKSKGMEVQRFHTVLHRIPSMSVPRKPPIQTHCSSPKELEVIIISSVKSVRINHRICLPVDASVDAVSGPEHY